MESLELFTEVFNRDLKNDVLVFHFIMQELNERLLNWSAEKAASGQYRDIVTLVQLRQLHLSLRLCFYTGVHTLTQS